MTRRSEVASVAVLAAPALCRGPGALAQSSTADRLGRALSRGRRTSKRAGWPSRSAASPPMGSGCRFLPIRHTECSTSRCARPPWLSSRRWHRSSASAPRSPFDDPEWRKWINEHFYVRQGVSFKGLLRRSAGGVPRAGLEPKAQALARHHAAQPHPRRTEPGRLRAVRLSGFIQLLWDGRALGAASPGVFQVDGHHL